MATTNALIGLGIPAEVAKRMGWQPTALVTTGSAQASAGGLMKGAGNQLATVTVTTAADAVTLPAAAEVGDEIVVTNPGANAGVIFPPVGGAINGNATNASVAIAAAGTAGCNWRFMKVSTLNWIGRSGADAT